MTLIDLIDGLTERGHTAGHVLVTATYCTHQNQATLRCTHCPTTVTTMLIGQYGGWRINPDITALDRTCHGH